MFLKIWFWVALIFFIITAIGEMSAWAFSNAPLVSSVFSFIIVTIVTLALWADDCGEGR